MEIKINKAAPIIEPVKYKTQLGIPSIGTIGVT